MADYSKNFLASMTGFMNLNDEPDNVNTGDPAPAKPSRIPLPDYKNPQSRLSYATSFKKKYAPESLPGFGEIPLRVNEKPVYGSDTSKNLAIKAAKGLGLDPALFYASSMIEGQGGLYVGAAKDEKGNPAYRGYTGDKNFPVSGLWGFGLDSFQDYYPTLKKKGYLSDDFDKEFTIWEPEGGPLGPDADPESVMFRSTDAGVKAKAAMMRAFYDETEDYAKKKGIDLTPEQRDFFGLAHFNSGTHGYELLEAYQKAGLLKGGKLPEKMPNIDIPFKYKGKPMSKAEADKLHKQIYNNVAPRLAAARGLKEEGLFD
jgi:hypothetical protein